MAIGNICQSGATYAQSLAAFQSPASEDGADLSRNELGQLTTLSGCYAKQTGTAPTTVHSSLMFGAVVSGAESIDYSLLFPLSTAGAFFLGLSASALLPVSVMALQLEHDRAPFYDGIVYLFGAVSSRIW